MESLIRYVEEQIKPQYQLFDRGHSWEHIQTVIDESLLLARHYDVELPMVYAIAAFHDIGLAEGRKYHHIASGRILSQDSFIASHFTAQQIETMREAIEDHRASAKSEPRTIYGMIVAEADRVISSSVTLRRTIQYGLELNPSDSPEQHYQRMVEHLEEKYAAGGYLKLYITQSPNAQRLEQLRELIANKEELHKRFVEIYEQEKTNCSHNDKE